MVTACWYCGVIVFLYRGFHALPPLGEPGNHRFSVIIAARNEAANIVSCLESIFAQSIAPDRFEVIVVNDRSTDTTAEIVTQLEHRFPNLSHLNIEATPTGVSPKKWAVAQGVAQARHEIIVFTDADCRVSPTWI